MKDFGVSILEHYLLESPRIVSFISKNDKTPLYDGSLFLYRDSKNSNENLIGNIPVQLKGERRTKKSKPSHPLSLTELEVYRNNGGVLFIKVIYEDKDKYDIYARNLLPVDIERLKSEAQNKSKTITVHLEQIKTHQDFEMLCSYFLKQEKYQTNPDSFLKEIPEDLSSNKIIINSISNGKHLESLFSNSCYTYIEQINGTKIPILTTFKEISQNIKAKIRVRDIHYFKHMKLSLSSNSERALSLNPILKLRWIGAEIETIFADKTPATIEEIIEAFEFVRESALAQEFYINETKFQAVLTKKKIQLIEEEFRWLKLMEKVVRYFRLTNILSSIQQINDEFATVEKLSELIFNEEGSDLPEAPDYHMQELTLLGKAIIILVYKVNSNKYRAIDFFSILPESLDLFRVKIEKEEINCSRFLLLSAGVLPLINDRVKESEFDLIKKYDYRLYDRYVNLTLDLILAFDKVKETHFLNLATKLIRLPKKNDLELEKRTIRMVNLLQIKKRVRRLKRSENRLIISLKQKSTNPSLTCCFLILLESFQEFELEFTKLGEEEQENFKSWPIFKLSQDSISQ